MAIELKSQLDSTTATTRALFTSLKNRLQVLQQGNANLRAMIPLGQSLYNLSLQDIDVREQQVGALKERFKDAIQRYTEEEKQNRAKQRARLERQVKVVNPNLDPAELQEIVKKAEEGDGAMFTQAVRSLFFTVFALDLTRFALAQLQTNNYRSHAARGALREVQNRAAELARIEQTIIELAQLFQDVRSILYLLWLVLADDGLTDGGHGRGARRCHREDRAERRPRRDRHGERPRERAEGGCACAQLPQVPLVVLRVHRRDHRASSLPLFLLGDCGRPQATPATDLPPCHIPRQIIVLVVLCVELIPPAIRAAQNDRNARQSRSSASAARAAATSPAVQSLIASSSVAPSTASTTAAPVSTSAASGSSSFMASAAAPSSSNPASASATASSTSLS